MRITTQVIGVGAVVLLTVAFAMPVLAAGPDEASVGSSPEMIVVRVEVGGEQDIAFLDESIDVWHVDLKNDRVEAAVDQATLEWLRELGFQVEVDVALTEKYGRPRAPLKGQRDGIPAYPCYRTVEEMLATGAALAAAYPDLAEWIDIGDSWEKVTPGGLDGYDLMVLRLTNTANGIPSADKPRLWVMGSIHAREYVTAETATRFAEHLLANYGVDPDVTWVLDHHEVHILLVTNPDGRKHAETGQSWRKNTNENYCGATSSMRGADLNRNCDFEWIPYGTQCGETYSGPFAASEPETQAMHGWLYANFPDWRPDDDLVTPAPDDSTGIFIDLHSHGGEVLSAFVWRALPEPNQTQAHRLGRKFTFFTGYSAKPGGGYQSYYQGTTKDFGYGRLGMPAYTFELGDTFFESCGSFEQPIYPDNLQSLLYASRAVRAPYTQSSGPEVVAPGVDLSVVAPGDVVTVTAVVDDTRYGPGSSSPPVSIETITEAEFYVDVPPWQAGAAAVPMSAADGAFNSSSEAVTGSFSVSGLADGRHTVYLRGRDAAGYWGTVRAVWVWVRDPSTAGHIAGVITDADTGLPLEATIGVGGFTVDSSSATGSYDLQVPPGTYDVTVTASGYGPVTDAGVGVLGGSTTTRDFELHPYRLLAEDDVEGGNTGWTAEGLWAITTEASSSPTHSWTDSPGGNYGDNWDYSLTSPSFDLTSEGGVVLEFSHIYDLETSFDTAVVEVSADGGDTWSYLTAFNGTHTASWERVEVPAPQLDHASSARVRFRITTDGYATDDGWHIDDIVIRGHYDTPPGLLFDDDFETGDTEEWSHTEP